MTTLEKIRAEIDKYDDTDLIKAKYVRQILDKYAEQEPCDDDYQTDMDEAWKQAKREPCDDVVSRQAVLEIAKQHTLTNDYLAIQNLPPVRPQEQTGKCRTCKYGEIYNDLWCKCHDPLLDGVMVKMTDQCRAEEIIDLNRKYRAERSDKE